MTVDKIKIHNNKTGKDIPVSSKVFKNIKYMMDDDCIYIPLCTKTIKE